MRKNITSIGGIYQLDDANCIPCPEVVYYLFLGYPWHLVIIHLKPEKDSGFTRSPAAWLPPACPASLSQLLTPRIKLVPCIRQGRSTSFLPHLPQMSQETLAKRFFFNYRKRFFFNYRLKRVTLLNPEILKLQVPDISVEDPKHSPYAFLLKFL